MNKAFTLIEILVAMAIFSLIIGASSGVFVSALRTQRKSLAQQELLNQASFALDYISRSARMAKKELNCLVLTDPATCDPLNLPYCLSGSGYGYNYELTRDGSGLKFINTEKICQEFFLEDARLKKGECVVNCYLGAQWEFSFLTSNKLQVEAFELTLSGETQEDSEQPKLEIFLKIKGRISGAGERPELKLQTTVSQRDLDIYVE